jgi:hypothetical protein
MLNEQLKSAERGRDYWLALTAADGPAPLTEKIGVLLAADDDLDFLRGCVDLAAEWRAARGLSGALLLSADERLLRYAAETSAPASALLRTRSCAPGDAEDLLAYHRLLPFSDRFVALSRDGARGLAADKGLSDRELAAVGIYGLTQWKGKATDER